MTRSTTIYRCGALLDAAGTCSRPGDLVVCNGIIAPIPPPPNASEPPPTVINLPEMLVMSAMVNAHAHLDLTAVGSRPYAGDFFDWAGWIMAWRQDHPEKTVEAVKLGVAMSQGAGVGWVGDIAGSDEAVKAFVRSGMAGVSFIECFGLGLRQVDAIDNMRRRLTGLSESLDGADDLCRVGVQPHAPYSAGPALFDAATTVAEQSDLPLCTHLAETPEELQFVRDAAGPLADRLRSWGKWDETIEGSGLHPVDWLRPQLARRPWLLAHCNYVEDEHIRVLADCGASVVYCPVAGDYFGHPRNRPGGHRYRDMLDAGVNVCLGTDSILCQPTEQEQPLGIMAQMRHVYRRDGGGTDLANTLLKIATINGLKALGLDPTLATLQPGAPARLAGVRFDPSDPADPLTQVLENDYPVESIVDPHTQE